MCEYNIMFCSYQTLDEALKAYHFLKGKYHHKLNLEYYKIVYEHNEQMIYKKIFTIYSIDTIKNS